MSSTATLERGTSSHMPVWVEMDESDDVFVIDDVYSSESAEDDVTFIELVEPPTITYPTHDDMRFGPRRYTARQIAEIRAAVQNRRPLSVPPLPLDN